MKLAPIRNTLKSSYVACTRTVQKRNRVLSDILHQTAGSKDASMLQAGKMIKSFGKQERAEIIKSSNIPNVEIGKEALVAMKVDLGIPWEKLKTMSRYTAIQRI